MLSITLLSTPGWVHRLTRLNLLHDTQVDGPFEDHEECEAVHLVRSEATDIAA